MLIDIINTYYGRPDLPMGAPKGTSGVDMTSGFKWPEAIVDQYPHDVQSTRCSCCLSPNIGT